MSSPDGPRPALTVLTEEEEMFRGVVRAFAEAEVRPRVAEMEAAEALDPGLLARLFEMGLMGIGVPEAYGGAGGSLFLSVLAVEELSRVDPSVGVVVDVQNTLVQNAIARWGSDAQRSAYLPGLAERVVGAYSLSEPGSGSDAFALACRAVADGDDWVLTGRKAWVTNGAEAELFLVFATVDPGAGHRGVTAFLVPRATEGLTVGKREKKLGIRASSTTELILDGCRVPATDLLGEAGKGYRVAIETLNEGRIGIGAQMVGLAQGALDHTLRYVAEREQFGRPVGSFQAVRFQLAELATGIQAARLLVYDAARRRDSGEDFLVASAQAKLWASRVAQEVASACVDLHGGYGFTREYPVEKLYRDAKIGTIYEGTSNMQLETIARFLGPEV